MTPGSEIALSAAPRFGATAAPGARKTDTETAGQVRWALSLRAIAVLAVAGGAVGGIHLHAAHGPVRDHWLGLLRGAMHAVAGNAGRTPAADPLIHLPAHVTTDRLLGAIDLAATLSAGRPIRERGLLTPENDAPAFLIAGLERHEAATCGLIVQALDRFAGRALAVALDEREPDQDAEAARRLAPDALSDRLGLWVDLDGIGLRTSGLLTSQGANDNGVLDAEAVTAAHRRFGAVRITDGDIETVSTIAAAFGCRGLRPVFACLAAARAAAACAARDSISDDDIDLATQLVLLPRATCMPQGAPADTDDQERDDHEAPPPADGAPDPEPERDDAAHHDPTPAEIADHVIAATASALPENVLAAIAQQTARSAASGQQGRSGAFVTRAKRGRAYGSKAGTPGSAARLNLIETLRAAAPWQRMRGAKADETVAGQPRVRVVRDDLRIYRHRDRTETLAIFVVDASGSSAVQRLGEAKGAIETMLSESYSRRDHVSLIAVRGRAAETLLAPTRSLTRARRALSGLPGGGGTPLASGLDQASAVATHARRQGLAPLVVVLTDGQANIDRSGSAGRKAAMADAESAARGLAVSGIPTVVIDTAHRAQPRARAIADHMGARYIALPRADADGLARALTSSPAS
ncbi:MAG: VWA domain-containing protein [Pseudomonadota bacterium]